MKIMCMYIVHIIHKFLQEVSNTENTAAALLMTMMVDGRCNVMWW